MSRPNPASPLRAKPLAASRPDDDRAGTEVVAPDGAWRAHIVWLRTALRRRFSSDLADDLTQETYLRVAEQGPPRPLHNPRGFLMTVASNLARDAFRRERVRADHAARSAAVVAPQQASSRTAEDDLQVRETILSLPPKLREVLLLSKIGGLTNREIAQRYGLSVRAVDKRLQKAIALFVAQLRD